MVEVYKDILNPAEYEVLETTFTSDEFSWYFSPHHLDSKFNSEEPDLWHFTHSIFDDRQTSIVHGGMRGDNKVLAQQNSPFYQITTESIVSFMERVHGTGQLQRCKANLYTNQGKQVHYNDHVDQADYGEKEILIAILSIGESNGGTVVGDTFYKSHKNQLIVLNNVPHHGVSQTDSQTRICINYNFER